MSAASRAAAPPLTSVELSENATTSLTTASTPSVFAQAAAASRSGAPTNLRVAATGPGSVTLAWDKPSGGSVSSCSITELGYNWFSVPATQTTFTAPSCRPTSPTAGRSMVLC